VDADPQPELDPTRCHRRSVARVDASRVESLLPSTARQPAQLDICFENIAEVAHRVREADVEVRTEICQGKPYEEIVKVAKAEEVELIVIATHGYTGFKHFMLGSTAERVVRTAPCPVLVVREKERDFVS
jgi:nucleotide-binding universal stress UspA family protein